MKKLPLKPRRHLMTPISVVLLLVLTAAAPAPDQARAQVYHVDAERGADTFPGTEQQPFRTVERASQVAEPGDTVLIHPGIYHEQIGGGRSGRKDAPITYQGTDPERVIFQGTVPVSTWQPKGTVWVRDGFHPMTPQNAFVMVDEQHFLKRMPSPVNLPEDSFHLSPDGAYTIRLAGDADPGRDHRVEVYELDFAFDSGDRWGGTAKSHVVLRNLTLEKYFHAILADFDHPADNCCWELDRLIVRYNHDAGVFSCVDDWYVHHCRFEKNGSHGCQIDGARVRFQENTCEGNEYFSRHEDAGCGLIIGPHATAHSCLVSGNLFHNNGASDGFGCGVYLEGLSTRNQVVENLFVRERHVGVGFFGSSNNLVANNVLVEIGPDTDWDFAAAFAVGFSREPDGSQSRGNLVAHNTVWGAAGAVSVEDPVEPLRFDELNRFVNNLFAGVRFWPPLQTKPTVVLQGNAVFAGSGPKAPEAAWLNARFQDHAAAAPESVAGGAPPIACTGSDPGLVDPPGNDFRLRPASPLVDTGAPCPEVTTDRDGTPRPQGAAPDIGAYELKAEP